MSWQREGDAAKRKLVSDLGAGIKVDLGRPVAYKFYLKAIADNLKMIWVFCYVNLILLI